LENALTLHYEQFLAGHYTWMFGAPYTALVDEQLEILHQAGVSDGTGGVAGAESGGGVAIATRPGSLADRSSLASGHAR
jgi:hypothetical protein